MLPTELAESESSYGMLADVGLGIFWGCGSSKRAGFFSITRGYKQSIWPCLLVEEGFEASVSFVRGAAGLVWIARRIDDNWMVVELENFKLDDIAWRRQDIFRSPRLLEDLEM
jgi:hypothetical protein